MLLLLLQTWIKCFPNLRIKLRFGQRLGSWFVARILGIGPPGKGRKKRRWGRTQEEEEEKFCWVCRAKLTILVALMRIFLLADLLIAAEILRTQCLIIAWTFDFLTSPSTNCNLSLICSRKRFLMNYYNFYLERNNQSLYITSAFKFITSTSL